MTDVNDGDVDSFDVPLAEEDDEPAEAGAEGKWTVGGYNARQASDVSDTIVGLIEARRLSDAHGCGIYRMNEELLSLHLTSGEEVIRSDVGEKETLDEIVRVADFTRLTTEGNIVPLSTPADVRKLTLARLPRRVPELKSIIDNPVIGSDGALISGAYFDASSGVYVRSRSIEGVEEIAAGFASGADAFRWLEEIWLADSHFATREDLVRAVMLTGTLLMRLRLTGEMGPPGFAATSPGAAIGKTLLMKALGAGAGVDVAEEPWPVSGSDYAEAKKRLAASARAGGPMMLWDNLHAGAAIEADAVLAFITAEQWSDRILGETSKFRVFANVVLAVTGLNIRAHAEAASRWLTIAFRRKADVRYSRPNLTGWTKEHAPEVIGAMLRVLRQPVSEEVKARVEEVRPRFAAWSTTVAAPIMSAAGAPGALDLWMNTDDLNPNDEMAEALAEILVEEMAKRLEEMFEGMGALDQKVTDGMPVMTLTELVGRHEGFMRDLLSHPEGKRWGGPETLGNAGRKITKLEDIETEWGTIRMGKMRLGTKRMGGRHMRWAVWLDVNEAGEAEVARRTAEEDARRDRRHLMLVPKE